MLEELKRLQASGWGTLKRPEVIRALGGINGYIWRRPDSYSGGARQWRSSLENLQWLHTRLRDQLARGAVLIRSKAGLAELERVRQVDDEFKAEGKNESNHRVIAYGLAVEAWAAQLVPLFQRVQGRSQATTVMGRAIEGFFTTLNQPRVREVAGARR